MSILSRICTCACRVQFERCLGAGVGQSNTLTAKSSGPNWATTVRAVKVCRSRHGIPQCCSISLHRTSLPCRLLTGPKRRAAWRASSGITSRAACTQQDWLAAGCVPLGTTPHLSPSLAHSTPPAHRDYPGLALGSHTGAWRPYICQTSQQSLILAGMPHSPASPVTEGPFREPTVGPVFDG